MLVEEQTSYKNLHATIHYIQRRRWGFCITGNFEMWIYTYDIYICRLYLSRSTTCARYHQLHLCSQFAAPNCSCVAGWWSCLTDSPLQAVGFCQDTAVIMLSFHFLVSLQIFVCQELWELQYLTFQDTHDEEKNSTMHICWCDVMRILKILNPKELAVGTFPHFTWVLKFLRWHNEWMAPNQGCLIDPLLTISASTVSSTVTGTGKVGGSPTPSHWKHRRYFIHQQHASQIQFADIRWSSVWRWYEENDFVSPMSMLQISIQWPHLSRSSRSWKLASWRIPCWTFVPPVCRISPRSSSGGSGGGGADGITVIAFQRLWWAYHKLGETLIDFNDRPRSCGVVFCRLEQQCECSHSSTWFLLIFAHAWWATYNFNIMSGVQRCLCVSILCDTYVTLMIISPTTVATALCSWSSSPSSSLSSNLHGPHLDRVTRHFGHALPYAWQFAVVRSGLPVPSSELSTSPTVKVTW